MSESRIGYRPLGIYRTLLALAVLAQHVRMVGPEWMHQGVFWSGSAAVVAFFGLSGLVITEAAEVFYARRPVPFAVNRAIRIMPQLLLATLLSAVAHWVLGPSAFPNAIVKADWATIFSTSNLAANVVSIIPGLTPAYMFVPYVWALEIEVLFYGALFLGLIVALFVGSRAARIGLLALAVLSYLVWIVTGFDACKYATFFVFGGACYWSLRDHSRAATTVAVLSYAASLHVAWVMWIGTPGHLGWVALVAVLLAVIPVLARLRVAGAFKHVDRRIGDLSYPIYLQQFAVIVLVNGLMGPGWAALIIALVLAVAAAWLSDRVLERAIVSLRNRVRGRSLDDAELGTTAAP